MSVESENVKRMVRWALKLYAGPIAEQVPLDAIDALVDRSETSKGQLIQIKEALQDRLPAGGVATQATLEQVRQLLSQVQTGGYLWTKDTDTKDKVETLRVILAAVLNVDKLRVSDADNLTKLDAIIARLDTIKNNAGTWWTDRTTNLAVSEVWTSTARQLWNTASGAALDVGAGSKEFKLLVVSSNSFTLRFYESLDGVTWHQVSNTASVLINTRNVLRSSVNVCMPWVRYDVTNTPSATTVFTATSMAVGR